VSPTYLVIVLLWALTVTLFVFRGRRRDRSILYSAGMIAVAATLDDPTLYEAVDTAIGGVDLAHLAKALTFMCGVYFLARGLSVAQGRRRAHRDLTDLVVSAVVVTVCFICVPTGPGSHVNFMGEYGHVPAAYFYNIAQYLYIGYVFVGMAVISIRTLTGGVLRERAAAVLMLLGAVFGIGVTVTMVIAGYAHVTGQHELHETVMGVYTVMNSGAMVFLVFGVGYTPVARWVEQARWNRQTARYLDEVTPLWENATQLRPSLHLEDESSPTELRLHRRIVEIRDAAADRAAGFTLSPDQQCILTVAESHLMAGRA